MIETRGNKSDQDAYCIRWNGSKGIDLPNVIRDLRENSEMFDATLVCSLEEGGSTSVRAHKLILSAYSPVFRDMFKHKGDRFDPLIYLKGLSFYNLSSMLDFMYNGSVNISQTHLKSFLEEAESLQIKGLKTKSSTSEKLEDIIQEPKVVKKDTKTNHRRTTISESQNVYIKKELGGNLTNREFNTVSVDPKDVKDESIINVNPMDYIDEGIGEETNEDFRAIGPYNEEDVDEEISNLLKMDPTKGKKHLNQPQEKATFLENEASKEFQCTKCNYISTKRGNVVRHIQGVHTTNSTSKFTEKCGMCGYRTIGSRLDRRGKPVHGIEAHKCLEKPIKCIKCKYFTTRNDEWEKHASKHLKH